MVDFIKEYNFANNSIAFVSVESGIIAFCIGLTKYDIGWGIGSFIIIMLLYGFPLFAGVFSLTFSLIEALIVYAIFMNYTASTWTWFITIIAFLVFVQLHRVFGNVDNVVFGYSLIIFDALIISGCIFILYKNKIAAISILIVLLIMAFVPIIRVFESITLAIGTSFFMYWIALESLTKLQSFLVALFVLAYTSVSYVYAYWGIDYKGFFQSKKNKKYIQEHNAELWAIKNRIYEKYPDLEKSYYYFYTEVCKTESEKIKFDYDWYNYLLYLDSSSEKISFNQYFDKEKLYRTSHYNRDYAKEYAKGSFSNHKQREKDIPNDEDIKILYFAGVENIEDLKKRYYDLLKIFHPDNQNGDVTASQNIQREYEFLLQKLNQK